MDSTDKDAAPAEFTAALQGLVDRFTRHYGQYKSHGLDEANLRLEYLDPFFSALGWDVANTLGAAPHLKEVRVESPALSAGRRKRADFVFRLGGLDRWVCEAKSFSENLDHGEYQCQNYAFNLRLWISLLTNFDELRLYVVGAKPDALKPFDVVPGWQIRFSDYMKHADKLWSLLSKQAVHAGAIEKFVQNLPKAPARKGRQGWLIKPERTKQVDYEFLHYLQTQRAALATDLKRDNRTTAWGADGLNEAVQKIIDRLLFQRVCEDRGIDTYKTLRGLLERWHAEGRRDGELWRSIVSNFHDMAVSFNGGLYGNANESPHFADSLHVRDSWLEGFIEELSGDDSPYLFNTLSVEILGSVYERFLGSVIDSSGRLVPKPEVRKAGGVYYTPESIVRFIIRRTLRPLLEGRTPAEVTKIRVVDPACGSGSFLIAAFTEICDYLVEWYLANAKAANERMCYRDLAGDLHLTTEMKRRVVRSCIFGVDIDPQAVEVTQLSLYLKILEGETKGTLLEQIALFPRETFLPDLSNNILVGNSLIGEDIASLPLETDELASIRPFNWATMFSAMKNGGFDCVIGNPPYDVLEKDRKKSSWPHDALQRYLDGPGCSFEPATGGKLNLYRFFVVRAFEVLRPGGYFGMIMPLSILGDISCKKTRSFLLESSDDIDVCAFPQKDNKNERVFFDAKLSTCVITTLKAATKKRGKNARLQRIHVSSYPRNRFDDACQTVTFERDDLEIIDPDTKPIPLLSVDDWEIAKKIHTLPAVVRLGALPAIRVTRGEINQTIYKKFITDNPDHARLLKGAEVTAFGLKEKMSQGERQWLDEKRYLKGRRRPQEVACRRIATQRITGVDERWRIVAAAVEPPTYFADSTNSVCVDMSSSLSFEYVLAVLNSRLMQWRFKLTSSNNNVGTNELKALPVRTVLSKRDMALVDSIARLAKRAMKLTESVSEAASDNERKRVRTLLDACRKEIDAQLYELYSLTAAEARLVERATERNFRIV